MLTFALLAVAAAAAWRFRHKLPTAGASAADVVLPHQQPQAMPPIGELPAPIVPWVARLPITWQIAAYVIAALVRHEIANRPPVPPPANPPTLPAA